MKKVVMIILSFILFVKPVVVDAEYVDRKFIIRNEGLSNVPYYDIGGLRTYCVGKLANKNEILKSYYSDMDCDILLDNDILQFEKALVPCITVTLNTNQYTAVIDFAYNLGAEAYCISTLHHDINNHNYTNLYNDFTSWDKVRINNKLIIVKSIYERRRREYYLFIKKDYRN